MKKFILGLALIGNIVHGATIEEASSLFAARANNATGVASALAAADMYANLSAAQTNITEKAILKMKESEAVFFIGSRISGKKNILATYQRGYEAAKFAVDNLEAENKAESLYWYAANQGRWGEKKGVLSSLSRWKKEMKPALETAMAMGEVGRSAQSYGAIRIAGRAYLKVPFESKKKGLNWLKEAYNKTLITLEVDGEEIEVAGQVNNLLFLLWGLAKQNKNTDMFCDIYDSTEILFEGGQEAWEKYDAKAIPETEKELTDFFSGKGEWETTAEYYDENC